ncbi:mucin-2 [Streptomyces sp. ISL-43]|uniref:mucin-2 n=1 Tax=Streptomyces sp. ISL-43 TaxID=2819183 RepID=UPI001BEA9F75|nr:mucin-2 [Streptomyces sp. ISL-43]MBT2451334.1 mucin-2 [Streptomyces sp. ISL-43]
MRKANPEDLEQLAKLLDGRGGSKDQIAEAFTRASSLGVTAKLGALRPVQTWTAETAPDLRKRAGILKAENGDPTGGFLWAGFSAEDAVLLALNPQLAILAGAASLADDGSFDWVKRQKGETYSDWQNRMKSDAVAKITGDKNMGEVVADYLDLVEFIGTAPNALFKAGKGLWDLKKYWGPDHKALKAPGTFLAQMLRGQGSTGTMRLARYGGRIGRMLPPPLLNFLAGNNSYAALVGKTWAWEANLLKVAGPAARLQGALGGGGFSRFAAGAGATLKTAGWIRGAGAVGSAIATGVSFYELCQKGNPVEAFKKDKVGYAKDVSGVLFNASMTAAMVAPNPWTIGAVAVTGLVYGGLSIWDNWDTVKKWPGKVADAAGKAGEVISKGAGKLADGAKKLVSKYNPFD